jgi:CheY-like chemotaxis protein
MKILIIEDHLSVRSFLQLLLEMDGHHVLSTHSSLVALELLSEFKPDLLISDFSLPGELTGADICLNAREVVPEAASIIITGMPLKDILDICKEAQPLAVLQKPVDYDRISRVIDRLVLKGASAGVR